MPIPLQALTRPGDYDIKESVAKGMGITAYRYRSRGARTAHELVLKGGSGESTRTPAEQKLMTKYLGDIDAGHLNPENVRADYKAGKLRERDARRLLSESKTPQLERDFRRLSLERALDVWELANDQERKQLRPILLKKKSQLENRVPAQRAPLQEKFERRTERKGGAAASHSWRAEEIVRRGCNSVKVFLPLRCLLHTPHVQIPQFPPLQLRYIPR